MRYGAKARANAIASTKAFISQYPAADTHKYMLLSIMQRVCERFLINGLVKFICAQSIDTHIDCMKMIYDSFAEDDRPLWLTRDQIEDYEARMKLREREVKENA